ncbi:MAG: DUF1015 domain-containing protein [Fimbriimonadaceae bacterium]|nr:DUF1015 domain-containing protein [Fimbriimonadaceae bacterium]
MATCEPFRALRYNPALGTDLSALVSPPYDVIDAPLQAALLADPHNISHLDLNPGSTDLNDPDNRYRRAAVLLGEWLDAAVLRQDAGPALYLYEQVYTWAGEPITRRGFFCRVRLEPLGTSIHPHERTFSGPKQDRYNLTCATRCNLSQVLGIYPDPSGSVLDSCAAVWLTRPDVVATGRDGVLNRLWVVADPAIATAVGTAMADRPIYIADGHHRYETALRYLQHLEQKGAVAPDDPARYTTFALLGSADPGVRVMPTHRVLSGLRGLDLANLKRQLPEGLSWTAVDLDRTDAAGLERWIAAQPLDSVAVLTAGELALIQPRSTAQRAALLPGLAPVLQTLNVALLHQCLLPDWLEPQCGSGEMQYVHRVDEALAALAGGAQAAFLLRAVPLQSILEVAGAGELMPQKSTYFYPKLLTGLVMYPLRD